MHRPLHKSKPGELLIAIANAIAILRMAELAFGFSVLPGTTYLPRAGASPIGFGWNSALGAALSGITILSTRRLGSAVVQLLAGFAIAVPMIAIVGYSYGLTTFYGRTSPYTAAILLIIAAGATLATSRHGIVQVLFSPFVAGRLARRQLLGAAAIPYGTGLALYHTSPVSALASLGWALFRRCF